VSLTIIPITLRFARSFIAELHRHNPKVTGWKFGIGVIDDIGALRGVLVAGRPVARHLDDGLTIEVNRTATDGCPNANSALYGAAWRIAQAMGYRRLITYTQAAESGASMRAIGAMQVRNLPPRKGWAASSIALKALRDPIGNGGVARTLWRLGEPLAVESAGASSGAGT
jgi:hypothetical protein